jgi:multidrug efflux pump subunit AcrA (membrane-fusion protein)
MASPSDRRTVESLRDDLAALRIDRDGGRRTRGRPRLLIAAAAVAIALVLVGLFVVYRATLGRVTTVRVAYATRSSGDSAASTARSALTGSGYVITGSNYISLGVRVAGRIVAYRVAEGERVTRGQPLVELDPRPFQADLERLQAQKAQAQANVALFKKELARLRELRERNVSSDADLDLKENQLRVAQAELASSDAQIGRIRLKEAGEMATPGGFQGSGDLVRLADMEELRAEIDVNESDLAKVRMSQDAQVIPDADPSRRYAARVVELAAQVNRQKGTLRVEVRILEPDEFLKPDMSARVSFLEPPREPSQGGGAAVLAPASAIRRDARGTYAWVVSAGTLRRQPVETAAGSGDPVTVVDGLLGGEALVVGDAAELREQQGVQVESPQKR